MAESLITEITSESIQRLLRGLGWPASLAGTKEAPQIVSAVHDVNFNIRFGTPAQGKPGWSDFTISAPFTVDQQVSPVVGAFWNRRNRFDRVYRSDTQLFLDMDVVVAGGVSPANLRHQFAVWSDVARLFVRHLKADHAVLARYNAAKATPDGRTAPQQRAQATGNGAKPVAADRTPSRLAGGAMASKSNGGGSPGGGAKPA